MAIGRHLKGDKEALMDDGEAFEGDVKVLMTTEMS